MIVMRVALVAVFMFLAPAVSQAHRASDSYLNITVQDNAVVGRWDIALRDLEHAIGLDTDLDGAITWGELKNAHSAIAAYALSRLELRVGGSGCALGVGDQSVQHHSDGAYAVLRFYADCADPAAPLTVDYDLLFDIDALHRGLLRVARDGSVDTAVLGPANPRWSSSPARQTWLSTLRNFVREGVWHIWIGTDHVLFLLTLLLPAVIWRQRGTWRPVVGFRAVFVRVAGVVTWFTLAHSVTLALVSFGLVALPGRLVEAAIAVSVVVAAVNNLYPILSRRLGAMAFGFGLIHGFGFAAVLGDLGVAGGAVFVPLLGFNLGVELGQLAIVAVVLPLIFALRDWRFYVWLPLRLGSCAVAGLGGVWFVERAFDTVLLGI